MFPIYKILAGLLILAMVGIVVAVSLWFRTDAGRKFKKRREIERREQKTRDDD